MNLIRENIKMVKEKPHIFYSEKISTCVGIVFSSVVISVIPSNNGVYNVLVTLQLIFHLWREFLQIAN